MSPLTAGSVPLSLNHVGKRMTRPAAGNAVMDADSTVNEHCDLCWIWNTVARAMAVAPEHTSRSSLGSSFGSRRNAITAGASAIAAVALAVAVAGRSCDVDDSSPQSAVREFSAAANAGDRKALYRMFGPETRRRLDVAAQRATDLVGGSQRYNALDMISISRSSDTPPPKDFILDERSESRAVVEVVSASGERAHVNLVKVAGRWRIEMPTYSSSP